MKIINIKSFSPIQLKIKIQQPLYDLFRKIYKGPLYETPDFCFQKCVSSDADVLRISMHYEENNLIGATVLKITPTTEIFEGKLVSTLEVTAGFLPEFRGNRYVTQFVLSEMIAYKRQHPKRLLCLCDLATSPASYLHFFSHPFRIYPRYDEETPENIEFLLSRLINRMSQYKSLAYPDIFIRQGAKPRENILQHFARLMHGSQNNPHVQYHYARTQGVLGWGLMIIQLIEQSAEEIESIVKNYLSSRGDERKPFSFILPRRKYTDFNYLVQLREQKEFWKNKTIKNKTAQYVSIKLNSKTEQWIFYHDRHPIFEMPALENTEKQIAAKKVELILHSDIDVENKIIIDEECGYIGLSAILMGADKVLFRDHNLNRLDKIKSHPLVNQFEHQFDCCVKSLP